MDFAWTDALLHPPFLLLSCSPLLLTSSPPKLLSSQLFLSSSCSPRLLLPPPPRLPHSAIYRLSSAHLAQITSEPRCDAGGGGGRAVHAPKEHALRRGVEPRRCSVSGPSLSAIPCLISPVMCPPSCPLSRSISAASCSLSSSPTHLLPRPPAVVFSLLLLLYACGIKRVDYSTLTLLMLSITTVSRCPSLTFHCLSLTLPLPFLNLPLPFPVYTR